MNKQLILSLLAMTLLTGPAQAADDPVPYPQGYRDWTHVKTMLIEPGHALANPFQGIHHVYANDKALKGLANGNYADGAVLVFDLLGYRQADQTITESQRKLVGVMHKNRAKFAKTGGWGFEGFAGDSTSKRLTDDGGASCFDCHAPQQKQDYVFSTYRR